MLMLCNDEVLARLLELNAQRAHKERSCSSRCAGATTGLSPWRQRARHRIKGVAR